MIECEDETRAEFIARIAKRYEVPISLIRYESIEQTDTDSAEG